MGHESVSWIKKNVLHFIRILKLFIEVQFVEIIFIVVLCLIKIPGFVEPLHWTRNDRLSLDIYLLLTLIVAIPWLVVFMRLANTCSPRTVWSLIVYNVLVKWPFAALFIGLFYRPSLWSCPELLIVFLPPCVSFALLWRTSGVQKVLLRLDSTATPNVNSAVVNPKKLSLKDFLGIGLVSTTMLAMFVLATLEPSAKFICSRENGESTKQFYVVSHAPRSKQAFSDWLDANPILREGNEECTLIFLNQTIESDFVFRAVIYGETHDPCTDGFFTGDDICTYDEHRGLSWGGIPTIKLY